VGPAWLPWVWTLLFSAGLAVFFTLIGAFGFAGDRAWRWESLPIWATWYGKNFVVCITVAALIHLMFDAAGAMLGGPQRMRRLKPWQRSVFFAGVPMLGVAVGWPLGIWLSGSAELFPRIFGSPGVLTGTITLALGISLVLHLFFGARTREIEAERRATEAQLRLLQAQIEPHFLFNTLANVQALVEAGSPRAAPVLGQLVAYLRAAMPHLGDGPRTLAEEERLVRAYLALMQMRMPDRLAWQVDLPAALAAMPFPPLGLMTLVENAVKHGIDPAEAGGRIVVGGRAEPDGGATLWVADTGAGLPDAPGQGTGLANLRARLVAQYGPSARLELQQQPAGDGAPGVRATLHLPPTAAGRAS
jgi:hypothetical protein